MGKGGTALDVQRKKGLLEMCVLAVLSKEPSYGYKIMGDVSACIEISESTQEHNGRLRKYYHITPWGRKRIAAFLEEWDEMKRVYTFVQEESAWNSPDS